VLSENGLGMAMGGEIDASIGSNASEQSHPEWLKEREAGSSVVEAAVRCSPLLEDVIHEFWGVPVSVSFLAVSDQPQYFWRSDDFYVSQLQLAAAAPGQNEPPMALLRLSDTACDVLLEKVLGVRESASIPVFDFRRISPLEASILSEFSRDVLTCLRKQIIQKMDASTASGQITYLVWAMQAHSGAMVQKIGKIALSLPVEALSLAADFELLPAPDDMEVPDSFFYHVRLPMRLGLGSGRMSLSDLNQLEIDDIVVLEQSRIDRMFLLPPGSLERLSFGTDPEEMRRNVPLNLPHQQESMSMESSQQAQQSSSMRQRLWDNLMIDVSAEFSPVKLPLKHLKQMSEGLVVEMGDLLHNKVCLQVEGKTLAWGELVIVGERFAVRIREVTSETAEEEAGDVNGLLPGNFDSSSLDADMEAASERGEADDTLLESPSDDASVDEFLNDDFDETFDENEFENG
jgi:flagellar motor switch protein FliN